MAETRQPTDGIEDQILASARDLCPEVGYDQFTMAMVADHVGCARATVYNHFSDRTQLIESLRTTYLDGYLDIQDRIRRWIKSHHTVDQGAMLQCQDVFRMPPESAPCFEALV